MHEGMPKPGKEHAQLEKLVGVWEGDEKMEASPWGPASKSRGKYTMVRACDGFFVVQDYSQEKDGKVGFRGHGVFGWDPSDQSFTWYWVDSMGSPAPTAARGKWVGDTLTFESKSSQGNGRYTFKFNSASSLTFKLENCFDGKNWVKFMEGTYKRK